MSAAVLGLISMTAGFGSGAYEPAQISSSRMNGKKYRCSHRICSVRNTFCDDRHRRSTELRHPRKLVKGDTKLVNDLGGRGRIVLRQSASVVRGADAGQTFEIVDALELAM